jgi:hypothetical protein
VLNSGNAAEFRYVLRDMSLDSFRVPGIRRIISNGGKSFWGSNRLGWYTEKNLSKSGYFH